MIFNRGRKDNGAQARSQATHALPSNVLNGDARTLDEPHPPLTAAQAIRQVSPDSFTFTTTADLEPISGLVGQERALRAIQFGADIKSHDFNLFVVGPRAAGKRTAVTAYLEKKAIQADTPPDWIYVNNFDNPNRPCALKLPTGRARAFERAMVEAIDELRVTLPTLFEGDDYQARRRQIEEEFRSGQEDAFEALNKKAAAQNIGILRTPTGFAMAPMHEGKVVKPEIFAGLPEATRAQVEDKIAALQSELETILQGMPKSDKERRTRLTKLNEETAAIAISEALSSVRDGFGDVEAIGTHLSAVAKDLTQNIALFVGDEEENREVVSQPANTARNPKYRRYMVNVMVANGADNAVGAPIVSEVNPTYANLIGRIEHLAQMGTLVTDFLLVKPGALHEANGGFLLLDARKLLLSPFAWEALKRTLRGREIRIEQPAETQGFAQTQTLDPQPIPLNVKVVLFGDPQLYFMLSAQDPDFQGLFKVQADFDGSITRSADNNQAYARLIAGIVERHELRDVDAGGVARLIDESARLARDAERLSVEIGRIADILREADYWAGDAGRDVIGADDIERAVLEHTQRADRVRDRSHETIERGIVMVDVDGEKVGQINGLSVLQLGDFAFGKPTRISARVRMGPGRVTDIEREVDLGGPLHSKGVMILWGFLAGRFAQDVPLALSASLVFEQSYGGVDGDSASSTELYALLSALAEVPIRQGLAVTGSVNQWGEVQAIGGVNEKIEGFFDICEARGLTGEQGVLIPQANVQHLMLRKRVREAIEAGRFAIHAVETIDQGIEILTGKVAGEREPDGAYPADTINGRVEAKLRAFAHRAATFARPGANEGANAGAGAAATDDPAIPSATPAERLA
ncbi:MAG: ATP-binding protein [Pseudomonadota bacterium]